MKVEVYAQSYNTKGSAPSVAPVGEFLTRRLQGLEPAALQVEVTACFRTDQPPLRTLEDMYEEFHRSLDGLPSVRYTPNRQRMEIRYFSGSLLAEEAFAYGAPSLRVFNAVYDQIVDVIASAVEHHKKLRSVVSLPALAAAIAAATKVRPATAAQLAAFVEEEHQRAAAVRAALSPWELLDVDWSHFHPAARECLNDPFFWDGVDEYAPHGNDTGADLLPAFRDWRKRNASAPVARFLPLMLKRWGFDAEVEAWQRKPLSEWDGNDESTMTLYDEATIAAAFAQLKFEVRCDASVSEAALQSIARQLDLAVHAHFEWTVEPERVHRLGQMQFLLEEFSRQDRS